MNPSDLNRHPAPRFQGTYNIIVVGAGIVGLATARELLRRHPGFRIAVLEKEPEVAMHQSGHNSGVLHSGLYYRPGSLRARLCREGKSELEQYAADRGIPMRRSGKLVVAVEEWELPALARLRERAEANGVQGLEEMGPERMREIEPEVRGLRALYAPETGVIDFPRVAAAFAEDIRASGGEIFTGRRVTAIRQRDGTVEAETPGGAVVARGLVSCAGLHSDRVAAMTGDEEEIRITPFRGDYYTLHAGAASGVRALIYPVPDPRYPFLGVHFTRTVDDHVHAGPNAVLAFAREGYRVTDVSPRDLAAMFAFRGFRRLVRANLRTGAAEMWRDLSKRAFLAALRRYLPDLRGEDLTFGPSGVRAQALDREGRLVDDFSFSGRGRVLHVRNAPSPAATASLAIARHLADEAERRFEPV